MIYNYSLVKRNTGLKLKCDKLVTSKKVQINSPSDIYNFIQHNFKISTFVEEQIILIALDAKNFILGTSIVSQGCSNKSVLNISGIFKRLLLLNANAFILVHNHPSGDSTPSKCDRECNTNLKAISRMIDIEFLDHIIIGNSFYSFKEEGW